MKERVGINDMWQQKNSWQPHINFECSFNITKMNFNWPIVFLCFTFCIWCLFSHGFGGLFMVATNILRVHPRIIVKRVLKHCHIVQTYSLYLKYHIFFKVHCYFLFLIFFLFGIFKTPLFVLWLILCMKFVFISEFFR